MNFGDMFGSKEWKPPPEDMVKMVGMEGTTRVEILRGSIEKPTGWTRTQKFCDAGIYVLRFWEAFSQNLKRLGVPEKNRVVFRVRKGKRCALWIPLFAYMSREDIVGYLVESTDQ